jgi:hypothetical protein
MLAEWLRPEIVYSGGKPSRYHKRMSLCEHRHQRREVMTIESAPANQFGQRLGALSVPH